MLQYKKKESYNKMSSLKLRKITLKDTKKVEGREYKHQTIKHFYKKKAYIESGSLKYGL